MGTRYNDQPPEHWADVASLDPTPVWKQYIVIGVFLLLAIAIALLIGYVALAAQFATPPALVPGNRLVLAIGAAPGIEPAASAKRIGAPLVGEPDAFWLDQPAPGQFVAYRATWVAPDGTDCPIEPFTGRAALQAGWQAGGACAANDWRFAPDGVAATAPKNLDQYLVSVSGDRIIVNMSRVIEAAEIISPPPSPR